MLSSSVSLGLLLLDADRLVALGQVVAVLLVGSLDKHGLIPQVGSQVGVGLGDGSVGSLSKVAEGTSRATGRGVAILDTGHLQELLGDGGRDDASTTGRGDETHPDGTALAGDLAGHGVGLANLVAPEASPDGQDGKLGQDDGSADGGGHLLGALDAQADVTVVVADGHKGLEPGPLTGAGLLLDGHDLQDLVLQLRAQESVDDLCFFDGQREEVDLLQGPDLLVLDEATELGDGDPLVLLPAAASTTATATATTVAKSTTETSTIGWC